MALYLLHFDRPYRHARHYLGYARDVPTMHERIDAHYEATAGDGKHHRLMQVIRAAGISFTLARVWPDGTRADERKKKRAGGHARKCPICREARNRARRAREQTLLIPAAHPGATAVPPIDGVPGKDQGDQ